MVAMCQLYRAVQNLIDKHNQENNNTNTKNNNNTKILNE